METKKIIFIILIFVAVIAVIIAFAFYQQESEGGTSVTANSTAGFTFADICHCAIIGGDIGAEFAIDSTTGKKITYPLISGPDSRPYVMTYFSPSGQAIAGFTENSTRLEFVNTSDRTTRTLFTTSGDATLAALNWSTDEKVLVVGTQVPADAEPSEGTWPTTFMTINIADGEITPIITRDQVRALGLKSLFPIAASVQAKTIIFVSGDMTNATYYIWRATTKKLAKQPLNITGAIYQSTANVNGEGSILWYLDNKLHRLVIDTLRDTTYTLNTYSDVPVSRPSPDGRYVVFLKQIEQQQAGILTRLDLQTGDELTLSLTPINFAGGLTINAWSPDGKYFVYAEPLTFPQKFFAIHTNGLDSNPRQLTSVPVELNTGFVQAILPL